MADSPSDFIDFNAFRDATSQSEEAALRRQEQDVEAKTATASNLLTRASQQHGPADAQGHTSQGLSQTGSYGDYLKAKQSAENARALMLMGRSGAYGDVRNTVDQQGHYSQGADDALTRLQGQENTKGAEYSAANMANNASQDRMSAAAAAAEAAKKQREFNDNQNRGNFNADLARRMRAQWAEQDARHAAAGGAGMFNPFKQGSQGFGGEFNPFGYQRGEDPRGSQMNDANHFGTGTNPNPDQRAIMGRDAYWGLEDNQRLAQMARSQGMNAEADKYQSTATYDAGGNRTKGGY